MTGLFITIEGVEGCGKSTQIPRLQEYLESHGRTVDVTREPGGTPIAEKIRQLLLDPENIAMAATTELLLYAAARAQHVEERIRPALDADTVVLCDRFADSTTVYQGAGRGLSPDVMQPLHETATSGLWPDLTLVLDLPVEVGLERAAKRAGHDRIELESVDFHKRVRQGFIDLAKREPERVKLVDATAGIDEVTEALIGHLDALLDGD